MPLSTALIIIGALSTSSMAQENDGVPIPITCLNNFEENSFQCTDGSTVTRNPANNCDVDACPALQCVDGVVTHDCKLTQICSGPDNTGQCASDIHDICNPNGTGCGLDLRCDTTSELRKDGDGICTSSDNDSPGSFGDVTCKSGDAISLCKVGQICDEFHGHGSCTGDIGAQCGHPESDSSDKVSCGLNLECDTTSDGKSSGNGICIAAVLIAVGLPCDAPTEGAVDPCAQGLECNQGDENAVCECHAKEAGGDSVCTESLICTQDMVACLDGSEAERNHLNGCKADCPLIAGGDACNDDNSCAQGSTCNQGDENAVCECKVTEAGDGSVCTVTSSDTIGKPGCKRRLRDNKQN